MTPLSTAAAVVVGSWLAQAPSAAERADPFETCESAFRAEPEVYESSYCFYLVAQREQLWDAAAERLDRLRSRHPGNDWLTLVRGGIEWTRDLDLAEALFREAASGFRARGTPGGEVQARRSLRTILFRMGRLEEAEQEVHRAMEVAESSGDPLVLAQALTLEATHLTDAGRDLGRAYRSLRRARAVSGEATYTARRGTLFALANLCFRMGLFEEAADHYQELVRMGREAGDRQSEATAQYGLVNARLEQLEELPDAARKAELVAAAREALATAVEVDNREVQVMLHRTLGNLLGSDRAEEAAGHHERCILLGRSIGQPRELGDCLWSMGRFRSETDPVAAKRYIDEALRLAKDTGFSWSLAFASRQRMRLSWKTESDERAIAESLDALRAIEALRDLQEDGGGSAGVFSAWTRDFYWLSGQLFQSAQGAGADARLELGFEVIERMRARVLLEKLDAARKAPATARGDELEARRQEVLRRIVDVHRRLLDPELEDGERRRAVRELERLETDEEELRAGIAQARRSRLPASGFATLSEIASRLAPEEAMLSFQVALWNDLYESFGGGAWVLAITRAGAKLHRLPDRVRVNAALPLFVGLFARRDGSERAAAAALYHDLLAETLASLPRGIERLIVVPDGELHRLPFGALREGIDAEPLAARYDLSVVPSATLWSRWRDRAARSGPVEALVMADPVLSESRSGEAAAAERSWTFSPESLGALPYARREGRAIERHLGERARLLVGARASETFLKSTDLDPFRVLHFAAHAVVDEERPERSAVVLSPGGREEDGLLQTREIVDLDLESKAVVLSACRSASGRVLSGEGVMGLARGFFEAGAVAVVGSLWPLRDDEAAHLFDGFYRHLASGESVAAALKRARQDAIAEDLPAAAWAPLIVMGDGSVVPFPEGRSRNTGAAAWPFVLVIVLAAFALYRLASRSRPRAR